ncbi:hypothetical protein L9F63_005060 [Diploptera punctata]|uniref:Uncharacterized protein n=1 Tax=Diploptera punctata TaxID=6984 RepID=A0AAD8E643_DIPPU|nr:hypothetical protein L9F63_005060 [Diploptera punctata]
MAAYARFIARSLLIQQKYNFNRCSIKMARISLHTDTGQEQEKPVQYSTSKAASWKASATRSGEDFQDSPWYQSYVISGSLTVFLIYFCILREENDMDEELGKSLYDRISGLEERQLEIVYDFNEQRGHDNTAVVARLNELKGQKS